MNQKYLFFTFLLIVSVILSGCGVSAEQAATLTAAAWTPTPMATFTPMDTPTPTDTSTPTLAQPTKVPSTIVPISPAILGTSYPPGEEAIAPGNAARVVSLARWGKGTASQIALSPDGSLVAVASSHGIYLYAADTFTLQQLLPADVNLRCLAFSPDGKTLASGSMDGVRLWDLTSGKVQYSMGGNGHDYVNSVAFSPDGKLLASGTDYATIDVWEASTSRLVSHFKWTSPYDWTEALVFSPDGKFLASAQEDSGKSTGVIALWDPTTGKLVNSYGKDVRTGWTGDLAFLSDGKTVAFAGKDATVNLWDSTANTATQAIGHQPDWIHSLAVSPDGKTLAAGILEGDILLWDTASRKILHTLYTGEAVNTSLAFSPDGETLYSGAPEGLRAWDVASGTLARSLLDHAALGTVLSFSPDGKKVASFTDQVVTIRDVTSGMPLQEFSGGKYAAISPDWSLLVAVSADDPRILVLYDLSSGKQLQKWSHNSNTGEIFGLAFSPDGRVLAQVEESSQKALLLWAMPAGKLLREIHGDKMFGEALAISPDGKTVATTQSIEEYDPDGNVQLWDVASGAKLQSLHVVDKSYIRSIAFSPDGSLLAIQTFNAVTLWDWGSKMLLRTLKLDNINKLAFSPDGKILAQGGWINSPFVTLWDVASGIQLATLTGHTNDITGLAFSPDGKSLVSSSTDGTLMVWGVRP